MNIKLTLKPNSVCEKTGYYIEANSDGKIINNMRVKHWKGNPMLSDIGDEHFWKFVDDDDTIVGVPTAVSLKGGEIKVVKQGSSSTNLR